MKWLEKQIVLEKCCFRERVSINSVLTVPFISIHYNTILRNTLLCVNSRGELVNVKLL